MCAATWSTRPTTVSDTVPPTPRSGSTRLKRLASRSPVSGQARSAMQHANPANEVFFRLWPGAGHGTADQPATRCDIAAAWLSFVMKRVGLPLAAAGPSAGERKAACAYGGNQ